MRVSTENFVLKGNIVYSEVLSRVEVREQSYVVCENGICAGVYQELPEQYRSFELIDCQDQLIIPGLVDLHIHAPQYSFRGLNMDMELLEWLNTNTFPAESKYKDLDHARKSYQVFAESMKNSATTRACIFATIHNPATFVLMDLMEASGLKSFIGKVNMDRNAPDFLIESSASQSIQDTIAWLEQTAGRYERVKPILTPRFIPSCTDELMSQLKDIQINYQIPLQSHLSENIGEVQWVQELCPNSEFYGDAYDQFELFGNHGNTVMAHCVHSDVQEQDRMLERGVYIAHCPGSNTNLSSGIAPIRTYLEKGLKVGLGTDVGGGFTESIFRAMVDAIQVSKLHWRLLDETNKPLTIDEVFYLATKGGGSFFGKVGSFEQGFEFDALVLDDQSITDSQQLTVKERLEKLIYLSDNQQIKKKFVAGKQII